MANVANFVKSALDRMINAFLSPYVEGLDMNQVSYGLASGTITLRDLRVKKSALDKLNLPFEIVEGRVGLLQLSLHWLNLGSYPVQVQIEDVHALVASTSGKPYDAEDEEKRAQALKQERLLRAEALRVDSEDDGTFKPGFIQAFQYKILNNIQITLKNIHLRYEDRQTVPSHPFAAGLTLASFSAYSTDGQWKPAFVAGDASEVHKVADLDSPCIYFDTDCESFANLPTELSKRKFTDAIPSAKHAANHQYLLKPVTGQGRFIWNRGWRDDRPQYDLQFLFDEIGSTLDQHQYRDIISLADAFHIYARQHQYRKFRPPEEEFAQNRPRALLKFAMNAILSNIHERNRKWTWEYFKERREDRHRYVELFKKIETRTTTPPKGQDTDKAELDELEKKLEFSDIRFFRSIARQELRRDRRAMAKLEERRRQEQRQQTYTGWIWGKVFGSGPGGEQQDGSAGESSNGELEISPETWKEVYDIVGYDEKKALAESFERPSESVKTRVSARLKRGSFALRASPHAGGAKDVISLVFDQFEAGFLQRPYNYEGSFSLRDFKVFDGTARSSFYKQIVHVKERERGNSVDGNGSPGPDQPFFSLKFEHRPLDERADNALTVYLRSTEVIYQKGYVEAVYNFLKPPESQLMSVDALLTAAGETIQGFTSITRAGLEYALQTHETVDVRLNLHAPIIIVPESSVTRNCNHLVIDAGQILVESNLVDKATLREVEQKRKQQYTDEDFKKLESLMYDSYTVKFKDAQFVIGPSLQACMTALSSDTEDHRYHLLERINIKLLAQNSIVPTVQSITRFKVSGELPNLRVNFSDSKYKTLMRLLDVTIPQFGDNGASRPPAPAYPSTNVLTGGFFAQEPDEYVVDDSTSHSEDHSDSKTLSSDSQMRGIYQKLFHFTFSVQNLQASLYKSVDGTEKLLAGAQLERFGLTFVNAQYDMNVDVVLGSVQMSVPQSGAEDLQLLSTKTDNGTNTNLMIVNYKRAQREHPEFYSTFEGIEQAVDVKFSTFLFKAVPEQVLSLYDFIMTTFVPEGNNNPPPPSPESEESEPEQVVTVPQKTDEKIRVSVHLASVEVLLIHEGERIATISLLTANVGVLLHSDNLNVSARLGNLLVTDDSEIQTKDPSFKKLLSIEGDDLAEFQYQTFGPEERAQKRANSAITLKTGAFKAHYLEEPLNLIYRFLMKLARLKGLYDAAAEAAVQRASEIEGVLFNVVIRSPIVVFPTDALNSIDSVKLKLGELSAQNEFQPTSQNIGASLKGISLSSSVTYDRGPSTLKIIDDVAVSVHLTQTMVVNREEDLVTPDYKIECSISDVKLNLTQLQCKRLLAIATSVPRVFEVEQDELPTQEETLSTPEEGNGVVEVEQPGTNLMPELEISTSEGKRHWTAVDLVVVLPALRVSLFDEHADRDMDLKHHGIVRFSLNDTSMALKMLSDTSLEVEIAIKSLTMNDTKPGPSKFREIIPAAGHDRNQFMLLFTMTGGAKRDSVAIVTVDSPQMILSINPLFSLLSFYVGVFGAPMDNGEQNLLEDGEESEEEAQEVLQSSQGSLDIRFDLHDALVSILESDTDPDTRAIQLHMKQLSLSQQGIIALKVTELGMSLARMGKLKESVRFLDDFDATATLSTQSEESQNLTDINVSCQPIIFRASYRDIDLILSIVNRAYSLFSKTMDEQQIKEKPQAKPLQSTHRSSSKALSKRRISGASGTKSKSSTSVHAKVIVVKEKLTASFEGFQLVLIGDLHEMPMFFLRTESFILSAADWSGQLNASARLSTSLNYYNLKNSHWEPFIDPWSFAILAKKHNASSGISVTLKSSEQLDMNLSSGFAELVISTLNVWNKEGKKVLQKARGSYAPYRIVNRTGSTILVWSDSSKGQEDAKRLLNGNETDWRFDDWKTAREHFTSTSNSTIAVQLEGSAWNTVNGMQVDTEGEFVYTLRPHQNPPTKLLCEVTIKDNVKVVTLRSTYKVVNQTLYPLEIALVDSTGRPVYAVEKIAPSQNFYVPLEAVTQNRIRIQPDQGFGYRWSSPLRWEDLINARTTGLTIRCPHMSQTEAPFRFRLWPITDTNELDYPRITLNLRAPIELENLLPFNIQYKVYDRDSEQNWSSYLRKGGIMPVHSVELGHLVLLSVTVQDSVFKPSEFAIINADAKSDFDVENQLTLADTSGRKLELKLNYVKYPAAGGAFKVQIYSPYIVINKTGLPFNVRSVRSSSGLAKDVAGDTRPSELSKTTPFLLSHHIRRGTEFVFRVSDSSWSKPINLEAPSAETEMVMNSSSEKAEVHLGLSWTEGKGKYKLSKIITITPRYLIRNKLKNPLHFREHKMPLGDQSPLAPGERRPLLFIRSSQQTRLTIAYPGLDARWSCPINLTDIGTSYIRMKPTGSDSASDVHLVAVDVAIENATIFVTIRPHEGPWPFIIENSSDQEIFYGQTDEIHVMPDGDLLYRLKPHTRANYAWDFPSEEQKKLFLQSNGQTTSIDIMQIGSLVPLKTKRGALSFDVKAEGDTQILVVSNYTQETSLYRPRARSNSQEASSSSQDFEAIQQESPPFFSLVLELAGLGISLVNKKLIEVVYCSMRSLKIELSLSDVAKTLDLSCGLLQIDNQLHDAQFPVVLQPTPISRQSSGTSTGAALPTVQASFVLLNDSAHGVLFIKYASVLLQALTIQLDEAFLYAILDLTKLPGLDWESETENVLIEHPDDIPEPTIDKSSQDVLYFETLELQPIILSVSFVRNITPSDDDSAKLATTNPLAMAFNVLTLTLGNLGDARLELNALFLSDARMAIPDFQSRVIYHYRQEVLRQLYRVLGSADFIGNPVGLFNNVSSGVADIFYEPWNGVVQHGGGELGAGIAKGAASFLKKTVFGVSDSVTKITSSVGKGLSAATLDEEFQAKRRMTQRRNKPKHAIYGVAAGAEALVTSVASGVEGVLVKPFEGAESEGALGFLKGMGKGLVGAVTKPVVGVFDLAANVSEGIRNTTTVFDTPQRDRLRKPRHVPADGILRPYSPRKALGQYWMMDLENGAYRKEHYVAHLDMPGSDSVVLITDYRALNFSSRRLRVEWDLPFSSLKGVSKGDNGIIFKHKDTAQDKFIVIEDPVVRQSFYNEIASAVNTYMARKRRERRR